MTSLLDRCGRRITRLRVAISNQCNLRCIYCRPGSNQVDPGPPRLLTLHHIGLMAEAAVSCGVESIRLTGGEPLLRRDLLQIISRLSGLAPGLDLALTTNGALLARLAGPLAQAGLKRVNVSLDSLQSDRFRAITGGASLAAVLAGLEVAERAELRPIKVNVVVMRGRNDDEILEMAAFARDRGYHVRFIEFMPLDGDERWHPAVIVPVDEIRARVERRYRLTPVLHSASPGEEYLLEGGPSRLSLIGAVSRPFCHACNRLRVTSDGFLRACLFSSQEEDLWPALIASRPLEALAAAFLRAAATKPAGHRLREPDFVRPCRSMFAIGG